jgi:hypothetical protein
MSSFAGYCQQSSPVAVPFYMLTATFEGYGCSTFSSIAGCITILQLNLNNVFVVFICSFLIIEDGKNLCCFYPSFVTCLFKTSLNFYRLICHFFMVLGFELRTSSLLCKHPITWATPPALFAFLFFRYFLCFCPGWPQTVILFLLLTE